MTRAAQGDKEYLVNTGTDQGPKRWRGGRGVLLVWNLNGTPNFEMQMDDGVTYVPVKDIAAGVAISAIAAAGMWNFELPACTVRMSAAGGTMNCLIVGV